MPASQRRDPTRCKRRYGRRRLYGCSSEHELSITLTSPSFDTGVGTCDNITSTSPPSLRPPHHRVTSVRRPTNDGSCPWGSLLRSLYNHVYFSVSCIITFGTHIGGLSITQEQGVVADGHCCPGRKMHGCMYVWVGSVVMLPAMTMARKLMLLAWPMLGNS